MGYALAAEALARGAEVTLLSGPTHLSPPAGVNLVLVTTADEMFRAALNQAPGADLVLKAAAVADYRPEERSSSKIKKESLRRAALKRQGPDRAVTLRLQPTPDILEELGRRKKPGQVLVGFAAETGDLESNALGKLRRKNLDLIVANRIGRKGEGFEADTNRALAIDRDGHRSKLPIMTKEAMAARILDLAEPFLAGAVGRKRQRAGAPGEGGS
jgi:phosphopantothenoylcysteine decarboxylase / phosphopantothenate---cysteine ligase